MNDSAQSASPATPALVEGLFRAHYSELCTFVYGYVRSREAAEDLVQDLFLRLWELRDGEDPPAVTRAYLYAAARNRALKWLRRRGVVRRWEERKGREDRPGSERADEAVRSREFAAVIDREIEGLPTRCQEIFRLSRHHHLSYAEIAETLEISVSTVEVQMWRALKRLRERLAPYLGIVIAAGSTVRSLAQLLGRTVL